jgi:putative copper resistance protein D
MGRAGSLLLLAAAYLAGMWRVGRRHPRRPWPAGRTAAFLAGLAVIGVATQSSIGANDDVLFSVHMVQHLLLIMVAPPLLVADRPVTLLLHAAGNPVHTLVKRVVRSRALSVLTFPPAATALYCAVVAATHLTPLMNLVVRNDAVHNAEHVLYVVTGYLFFLPVVGSEPIRITGAGVTAPAARAVDGDAYLAAYNAYLSTLDGGSDGRDGA